MILDFLYQIATAYNNLKAVESDHNYNGTSNREKLS